MNIWEIYCLLNWSTETGKDQKNKLRKMIIKILMIMIKAITQMIIKKEKSTKLEINLGGERIMMNSMKK